MVCMYRTMVVGRRDACNSLCPVYAVLAWAAACGCVIVVLTFFLLSNKYKYTITMLQSEEIMNDAP